MFRAEFLPTATMLPPRSPTVVDAAPAFSPMNTEYDVLDAPAPEEGPINTDPSFETMFLPAFVPNAITRVEEATLVPALTPTYTFDDDMES